MKSVSSSNCLNLSNPDIQRYIQSFGLRKTFEIYVQHEYRMPGFDAYRTSKLGEAIDLATGKNLIGQLLDTGQFKFEGLEKLKLEGLVPKEASAAFWRDAFYFGNRITRGEAWEEAFHAIFQRIIRPQERSDLLKMGQSLLKDTLKRKGVPSIRSYYNQMKERYPQTYGSMTEDQGLDRLYEEELAGEFVRYMAYGPSEVSYKKELSSRLSPILGQKAGSLVARLVDWLFTRLGILRNNYVKNREQVDIWLQKIAAGQYSVAQIRQPSDYYGNPSTRLIDLHDENRQNLSSGESQQVIRNLGALAMQLKWQRGLEDLSESSRIALAIEGYRKDYYTKHPKEKFRLLADQMVPEKINKLKKTSIKNPEYDLIVNDVQEYLNSMKGLESLEDELREDELGRMLANYEKSANEVGFDGFSTWLKQYIGTVGEPVVGSEGKPMMVSVTIDGVDQSLNIPVIEIADPNRIYYGLARSLGNTPDMLGRLQRMVQYASLDGNKATRAFVNRLISDLIPVTVTLNPDKLVQAIIGTALENETLPADLTEASFDQWLIEKGFSRYRSIIPQVFDRSRSTDMEAFRQTIEGLTSVSQLNDVLSPTSKLILNRVLKGFDLWTRNNMMLLNDPKTGLGQLFNANQNNPERTQFAEWAANNQGISRDSFSRDELSSLEDATLAIDFKGDIIADIYAVAERNWKRFNQIGITLSLAYVQYATIKHVVNLPHNPNPRGSAEKILASPLRSLFSLFTVKPEDLMSSSDMSEVFKLFANGLPLFTEEEKIDPKLAKEKGYSKTAGQGAIGRIKKIARGNAVFDESVFESSYKNAEGKSVYAHQSKTFHLDFFSWFQQELPYSELKDIRENGNRTVLRLDKAGKPVYLQEDRNFYQTNYILGHLLENPLIRKWQSKFLPFSIEGIRGQQLKTVGRDKIIPVKNGERTDGLTFKGMSPREFDLYMLNSLFLGQDRAVDSPKQKVADAVFTPVYLGNLESSGTADLMMVPFIDRLVDGNHKLTPKALSLLKEEIRKEYDRISRVSKELFTTVERTKTNGTTEFVYELISQLENFEKYNTGKFETVRYTETKVIDGQETKTDVWLPVPKGAGDLRALQFSDSIRGLINPDFMTLQGKRELSEGEWQYNLVVQALRGRDLSELTWLDEALQRGAAGIMKAHWNRVEQLGLVTMGSLWNQHTLLDPGFFRASEELGFVSARKSEKDEEGEDIRGPIQLRALQQNLYNKFLSDYINTLSLNQLIHGDPALTYKNDRADMFKRFKGRNGAIISFATDIAIPEWGIEKPNDFFRYAVVEELVGLSDVTGKEIDEADAQNWITAQGFRMSLHGMGRLDAFHARILDKIESGQVLTKAENQALMDSGTMYNPLKTFGFDGQKYLKKSDSILTKELTSYPVYLTKEEFDDRGGIEDAGFGRSGVRVGSVNLLGDLSSYRTESGEMEYIQWKARPEKAKLHEMRMRMEGWVWNGDGYRYEGKDKQIHLLMPISASKMLNPNVFKGRDKQKEMSYRDIQEFNVNLFDLRYYGLQTENPSGKKKIVDPTQNLEIIMNELGSDLDVYHDGKLISSLDMQKLWQDYLTQRDDNNYSIAWNTLVRQDSEGKIKVDLKYLREKAYQNLLATKSDKQSIDLFDPKNNYNLNLPLTREKFISQYFAHFSKEVLSQKRAGDAKTLVTSHGHKLIKKLERVTDATGKLYITWKVINQDSGTYHDLVAGDYSFDGLDLSKLQYRHDFDAGKNLVETSGWHKKAGELLDAAEGLVYVLDGLRHLKPRWDTVKGKNQITGYFSETLMPRWDTRIGTIPSGMRYLYGVRIPSQDKHSALNIEWVDALPTFMGSSMVGVKEIVELSGADYDVDKEYIYKPEGYWKSVKSGNEQEEVWVPYGSGQTISDQYDEWINYLLENQSTIRKENIKRPIEEVLKEFGLPTTVEEFQKAGGQRLNNGFLNNQMLSLMQAALANNQSINPSDPNGNQSNTPATMVHTKELKNETYNDKLLFESNDEKVPIHFALTHSQVHEKNGIGKSLIGVSVNFNLMMINAVKLGFQIHPNYLPLLNGGPKPEKGVPGDFQLLTRNHRDELVRTFDVNSAITSGNTDEMKEGLNAFFNMNGEAQGVVLQLVALGYSSKDALLLINQPAVRAYLSLLDKRNYSIALPSEEGIQYLSTGALALLALEEQIGEWSFPDQSYTGEDLQKMLYYSKFGGEAPTDYRAIQRQILWDFTNLMEVNKFTGNFTRFIKMKKGLDPDFATFDRLVESRHVLGFDNEQYDSSVVPVDIKGAIGNHPELAKQYLNYIQHIIPGQQWLLTQTFLRRIPLFSQLLGAVTGELKERINDTELESLNQAVETHLFTRMYQNWLKQERPADSLNPGQVYQYEGQTTFPKRWKAFQQEFAYFRTKEDGTVEKGIFADNPLFAKIQPDTERSTDGIDLLKLNTMTKLRPEQQEELIDGFLELMTRSDGTGFPGKQIAQELFYYYIVKDGWQFRLNSVSKVFASPVFSSLSHSLDQVMDGNPTEILQGQSIEKLGQQLAAQMAGNVNYSDLNRTVKLPDSSDLNKINKEFNLIQMRDLKSKNTLARIPDQLVFDMTTSLGILSESTVDNYQKLTDHLGLEKGNNILLFPRFIKVGKNLYERIEKDFIAPVSEEDQINEKAGHRAVYLRTVPSGSPLINGATGLNTEFVDSARAEVARLKALSAGNELAQKYYSSLLDSTINFINLPINQQVTENKEMSTAISQLGLFNFAPENSATETSTIQAPEPKVSEKILFEQPPVTTRYELWPGQMANDEQRAAIDVADAFIRSGNPDQWFLIEGKAGTGKSTIIRKVLKEFPHKKIVVSALSHQAKSVIAESIDKENIDAEKVTIAGLLGMKLDLETGEFTRPAAFEDEYQSIPPVETADIIVVDEASMINEEALNLIMREKKKSAKVIFLGDIGQLPPIRPQESEQNSSPSPVFDTPGRVRLLTRVRQGEESPILPFADYYWENSQAAHPVLNPTPLESRQDKLTAEGNLRFVPSFAGILDETVEDFRQTVEEKDPKRLKIVVYRNNTRQNLNKTIHDAVFGSSIEYNEGELLIFLDAYGKNFQNSDQVQVESARTTVVTVDGDSFRSWVLDLPYQDNEGVTRKEGVLTLAASEKGRYQAYVSSLFDIARKLPRGPQKKEALTKAWNARNRFASLDYAYAITSHKAQGSTYDRVIVHEQDIMSVRPTTAANKSQSIYTALTRARIEAIFITGKLAPVLPQTNADSQLGNQPCTKPG